MKLGLALDSLVESLKRLPGIGPRSAQRIAFHLLQFDRPLATALGRALLDAVDRVDHCARCNTLSEQPLCATCSDAKRDPGLLCVVESPADQLVIEQSLAYSGLYFVLLGRLSPLDGIGPRDIGLDRLLARATDGEVREVILATNFTNEGEATAHYVAEMLRSRGVKVSRIARGVPLGGELEYVDAGTLSQALLERREIE